MKQTRTCTQNHIDYEFMVDKNMQRNAKDTLRMTFVTVTYQVCGPKV